MKTTCVLAGACMLALLCGAPAGATTVNWSTGDAYVEHLGNNDLFGPQYPGNPLPNQNFDKVRLDSATGTLNLTLGVPQIVLVNPLTFWVGQTGSQGTDTSYSLTTPFSMARDITVNGITQSLVSPMTHVTNWYTDSLLVQAGDPVLFGDVLVTPLGWSAGFFTGSPGQFSSQASGIVNSTHPSPVYAEFEMTTGGGVPLVPEPLTMLGMFLGLGSVGAYIRRRRML